MSWSGRRVLAAWLTLWENALKPRVSCPSRGWGRGTKSGRAVAMAMHCIPFKKSLSRRLQGLWPVGAL